MIRHKSLRNLTICLLLTSMVTFAVTMPVQRVSALADPVDIAPIYDTTIVQFSDYVENTLTESQGDIFYIMLGMYLTSQAAASDYQLYNPHSTEGGVLNWLKDCGAQLYNTIILDGIQPDPITGIDSRKNVSVLLAYYMGLAVKASKYSTVQDFIDDVNSHDKYPIPLTADSMFNLNLVLSSHSGLYNWQHSTSVLDPANFAFTWITDVMSGSNNDRYYTYVDDLPYPHVKCNQVNNSDFANYMVGHSYFDIYHNIFVNTSNMTVYLCDDYGQSAPTSAPTVAFAARYYIPAGTVSSTNSSLWFYTLNFADYDYDLLTLFNALSVNPSLIVAYNVASAFKLCLADFIDGLYIGSSWSDKQPWTLTYDLDFAPSDSPDILIPNKPAYLDLKGFLADLLNVIDIKPAWISNIYNPDGSSYLTSDLIRYSVEAAITDTLYDSIPMPVDLNDLAEITHNNYIKKVKEDARAASSMIGEYVAFWHNVDSEVVYVVFGCALFTLICAFVGKMGK